MSRNRPRDNRTTSKVIYATLAIVGILVYYKSSSNLDAPAAPLSKPVTVQRRSPSQLQQQQIPLNAQPSADGTLKQRIVAIGDIHGDYSALTQILRTVSLIDMRGNWCGDNTVLVQTGDLVDRGPALIAITKFWDSLRPQAEKAGGQVVNLLGNHELMNALGDWRYVTKEDIASFGGERQRRIALSTGWIGQTWRTNYSITARVPFSHNFPLPTALQPLLPSTPVGSSSRAFVEDYIPAINSSTPFSHTAASFVHGGITPEYLSSLKLDSGRGYISHINAIGHSILEAILIKVAPLSLPSGSTLEQREFWSERGPMWARDYALESNERAICERAKRAADMLGVRHLIMGHTPNFEGVLSRCDGLILLIDTGISKAYGGAHSALEIVYTLTPEAEASGVRSTTSWLEKETVKALYTGGREDELLAEHKRTVKFSLD